ncbi:MAG: twin-arginine translocation signal domain-containing protein [Candidatus Brocadiia bacterium]|nr:MAG: twin-arginine translocation signal domain-containing protein [Candidatus Brocadiia bacterium]
MERQMNTKKKISRRGFLKSTAAGTAAFAIPYIITSSALGNDKTPPASERINLAHIGVGGQGTGVMKGFVNLEDGQVIAVCDAFKDRREKAVNLVNTNYAENRKKDGYKGCAAYEDFRELLQRPDIDAVVIATPDHWHVPIAIAAAKAGKDMYVEKPLGVSIEQNKAAREAIHRYGRIFQYGTQQRCFNTQCAFACELVRNGRLGKLKQIVVTAPAGVPGGSTEQIPVPEGFNYDMWLGPAPWSPYTADRCTSLGSWHVYDNSLGFIAGWGAHPLDIMHWGYPHIPIEYEGTGIIPNQGLRNTITNWNVRGRFASGVEFIFIDGPNDTKFVGEQGWVAASRGRIDAYPRTLLDLPTLPDEIHLLQNVNHFQNFLDAVKNRSAPASNIDSAVQSDFISHLSDIAIRTGRKILWDPIKETIIADQAASRMLSRPMRKTWRL